MEPPLVTPVAQRLIVDAQQVSLQLKEGLVAHQLGHLSQARTLYESVLATQPTNADALHLLGVIAYQSGDSELAVELIGQAIRHHPTHASAYNNRGSALKEMGRMHDALESYNQALKIKPDYPDAYNNRGIVLAEINRLEEALATYEVALALKPDYAEVYNNRGIVLKKLKRLHEALNNYERALALKPDYPEAHNNRGNVLKDLKRLDEAITSYNHALALKPDYADAHNNRGNVLRELKRPDEALVSYNQALAINPNYAEAHNNQGIALMELHRFEEALVSFSRAEELKADYAESHYNRGIALTELRRLNQAVASYDQALAIKSDYVEAHHNRGIALKILMRLDESLASYDKALALKPDYAEAQFGKSIAFLLQGNLGEGLKLYEWRWKTLGLASQKRSFAKTLWLGDADISGKTILIHSEQGLGDTLHACRYVALVAALGARVVLEVPKPLLGLMQRLEGVSEVLEQGSPMPVFDYHCPMMSLPLAFKTTLHNIPSAGGYLSASPGKVAEWRERLGPRKIPRVGLVWSGNPNYVLDAHRSLLLNQLLDYLPAKFEYISLQKGVRQTDRVVLAQSRIRHFEMEHQDFSDSAAICELVDLVVSTDTSGAHLAGALGCPTWLLLPHAPDWRWMLGRQDSPWYSSMRLYRQGSDWQWGPTLEQVASDLSALIP